MRLRTYGTHLLSISREKLVKTSINEHCLENPLSKFCLFLTSFSREIETRCVPYVRSRTYERKLKITEQKLFRIQNFIKNYRCSSYFSEKLRSGHAYHRVVTFLVAEAGCRSWPRAPKFLPHGARIRPWSTPGKPELEQKKSVPSALRRGFGTICNKLCFLLDLLFC